MKLDWRHILLVLALVAWTVTMPGVVAAISLAIALARWKRWPQVRVKHYFMSRKCVLPAAAGFGGMGVDWILARLGFWMTVEGIVIAAGAMGVVVLIFEGKLMKNIFDLIPADQQAEFKGFVSAPASAAGKCVDFSRLDRGVVIQRLKERVAGQDPTIDTIVPTLFTRARLPRPNKPLAVFLFVGPSGVGKTELSKAIAEELFGPEKMILLDLGEYVAPESVTRLIGLPAGYQGSEAGGWLPRQMARVGGTGLLVLDEVEKADPSVMRALLSLLDEARITEASTNTPYSATGFVIVLTSNLHQVEIGQIAATIEDEAERNARIKDELRAGGFSPEQLGRVDAIFPFRPLSRATVAEIVARHLTTRARAAGVELVSVDAALLIDLIQRHEKDSTGGVRSLVESAENSVLEGLLNVRDGGYALAAIKVREGHVSVEPVAADATASRTATSAAENT